MARAGSFILGVIIGVVVIVPLGAYLLAKMGGIAMATTAKPLPFEETLAKTALRASYSGAENEKDPLPLDDSNMTAGARVYMTNCAVCHGVPGTQPTAIAQGEFPNPPQLFKKDEMVTDDPEGVTHWKVSHGIRLTGMPGFANTLSDTERWQVTMLVAHADKLPTAAQAILTH